jgi:hypothetical protein
VKPVVIILLPVSEQGALELDRWRQRSLPIRAARSKAKDVDHNAERRACPQELLRGEQEEGSRASPQKPLRGEQEVGSRAIQEPIEEVGDHQRI